MRTIRHNNILLFYGAGVFKSSDALAAPFLVIEWCDRGSLRSLLKSNLELSVERRLSFCIGAAQGMQFLHATNKIHRDLKSGNILVSAGWVVKIADFGTSKLVSSMIKKTVPIPLTSEL